MAINYVKFFRGTSAKYQSALKAGNINSDTLYFIQDNGQTKGALYLGTTLISKDISDFSELNDINLTDILCNNDLLVYSEKQKKWVNKSILNTIGIFTGAQGGKQGTNGLVPAPVENGENFFLRGDGNWAPINQSENELSNYISSVSNDFTVSDSGHLTLNPISIAQVYDLQQALDNKVTRTFTLNEDGSKAEWILLSPENQAKLAALTFGDSGNLEISNKVNAESVIGLNSWINTNRENISGLYPLKDQEKLLNIEEGAQKNFISSINSNEFIVKNGNLSLAQNYITTSIYSAEIGDLTKLVKFADKENSTIVDEINYINERLQWQEI